MVTQSSLSQEDICDEEQAELDAEAAAQPLPQ